MASKRPYTRREDLPLIFITEPIPTCACGGRIVTKRTIPNGDGTASRVGSCNDCQKTFQVVVEFEPVTEEFSEQIDSSIN